MQNLVVITLSWLWRQPTLISVWNCFLSVKWTVLATFLSIQSIAWYIYYGSKANLSSQDFNLACRYLDGIIPAFLPLLICFSPVAKFLAKTKAAQSDSEANYAGSYPSPGAIFTTTFAKVFGP